MILFISFIVVDMNDTPPQTDITKRNSNMDHEKNTQRPHGIGGSDIAVVVTLHSVTDAASVLKSASYVFDTTGKVKGAHSL